jgi:D-amino-acid oxidase
MYVAKISLKDRNILVHADSEQFEEIRIEELPSGVAFGIRFTTITINAPMHIRYLLQTLTKNYGFRVLRQSIPEISSGFISNDTKVVFNCTGNAAKDLKGVQDPKCFPTRGQILLARAPQIEQNTMRHGKNYETYVIPRPYSNGNVILGGFMQKGVRLVNYLSSLYNHSFY